MAVWRALLCSAHEYRHSWTLPAQAREHRRQSARSAGTPRSTRKPNVNPINFSRIARLCVVSLGLVVAASACGRDEEGLATPSYVWNWETGLCGSTMAVDGDGELWTESGCENGSPSLSFERALSDEQVARIVAAFQAHPEPASFVDPNCASQDSFVTHRFTERRVDGSVRQWLVCLVQRTAEPKDPSQYPAPFGDTVRAFSE